MSEFSFHGRVAVVTGAGRGIGRAHARLLAQRGAQVVVNDLGGSMDGEDADAGPAQTVAKEIAADGGTAVANTHDVSTPEGGQAIIDTALDHFGRVDILINNAGIVRWGGLQDVTLNNLEHHLDVDLVGSFTTLQAAWPHFVEQGYGRVVLTTSSGVFGLDNNLSHAAAKGGVIGLARSTALAGEPHGIKVNLIAPMAQTRMSGGEIGDDAKPVPGQPFLPPAAVAPMVAYLAHESCPVNGEIYAAGAGRFTRVFLASTQGYAHPPSQDTPTVEDVAANWEQINDESGYYVPSDLMAWSAKYIKHQFT
ncbi:SDR family NAD(P)-dependent oxidoreductase [Streptomyces sp. NPDC002088]|uniref:SDR family NAD(P)-dependent oxidoreductase n=1 Tax=Streptomyces sp. NPDC002088 TaxID=3154665 RepID=UPI00331D1F22